ncbi:major facilitator superfamily domain-containing protein [Crucibulum laeve]|uniref:Major facilitator superfamily domain-containing protein n=1 Tax=Crucibulum laeve TaxID=68775 RepID=A0A5C3M3C3_9AGAR|nr:major facilitator superfamily domain-containing protein [Crucibulum laeve]
MERTPSHPKSTSDAEKDSSVDYVEAGELDFQSSLEKAVLTKMDIRILPLVTLLYLLAYLDRSNIGNARVAGMQKELHMSNAQYSIALTVTTIPYIMAEIPSNLLLKTVGPNLMLPTMASLWGIVTIMQGLVHNYHGLIACRFFLGLLEGGLFPGIILYLSSFYPRQRLQLRIAVFFSAVSLSGAFSGLLAFAIIKMDGVGGRPGWAWIFFLEGLCTVVVGVLSFFVLPRSVEDARFLNESEKELVLKQLRKDGIISQDSQADNLNWKEIGRAFALPQVWFSSSIFFFAGIILSSLSYFTPSILVGLGYTASRAQLMSVPPFAAGFVVTMLTSLFSDKYGHRGYSAMVASILCTIGFAMYFKSRNLHVQYGSLFFSIAGINCSGPALATWLANNAAPQSRRATAIAIGFISTNLGNIIATWLYSAWSHPPRYTSGTITLLVGSIMMTVLAFSNILYLKGQNRKKALIRQRISREEEPEGLGDHSAWFIYST